MEPFSTAAVAGAGFAFQAYSAWKNQDSIDKRNAAQRKMIELEMQVEEQRRRAMEIDARRRLTENVRNVQRARSLALTNATSQGAAQGSGLQGGYGQIAGQGNWNALGIGQSLEIGRNIFNLNRQISQQKIAMAEAGADIEKNNSFGALGTSLINVSGTFGKIGSGFGSERPSMRRDYSYIGDYGYGS